MPGDTSIRKSGTASPLQKAMMRQQRVEEAARLEVERTLEQAHTVDNRAMQDFYDSARDQGLWKNKEFKVRRGSIAGRGIAGMGRGVSTTLLDERFEVVHVIAHGAREFRETRWQPAPAPLLHRLKRSAATQRQPTPDITIQAAVSG